MLCVQWKMLNLLGSRDVLIIFAFYSDRQLNSAQLAQCSIDHVHSSQGFAFCVGVKVCLSTPPESTQVVVSILYIQYSLNLSVQDTDLQTLYVSTLILELCNK